MTKRTGKVQLRIMSNSIFTNCIYNHNGEVKAIPDDYERSMILSNCIITDNSNCLHYDDYGRITADSCNIIIVPLTTSNRDTPNIYCDDATDDDGGNDDCANFYEMTRTTSDTSEYQM